MNTVVLQAKDKQACRLRSYLSMKTDCAVLIVQCTDITHWHLFDKTLITSVYYSTEILVPACMNRTGGVGVEVGGLDSTRGGGWVGVWIGRGWGCNGGCCVWCGPKDGWVVCSSGVSSE